jgi:hypothetical protein
VVCLEKTYDGDESGYEKFSVTVEGTRKIRETIRVVEVIVEAQEAMK